MPRLKYYYRFAAFLVLFTGVSCSQGTVSYEGPDDQVSGSGVLISESRETGYFNSIHSSGPVTTVVIEGDTREILVTADDNVIQKVKTTIHGNALYISLKDGSYHNIWIRVKVVVPSISALSNTGTGSMKVTNITTEADFKALNSGTGQIILEGKADKVSLVNEGAGSINGYNFETASCTVFNEGAGNCEINCTTMLDGRNSGSGNISYSGDPTITLENTGTGTIIKQD